MSEAPPNRAEPEATPAGEFERQPVPERALMGFKSFVGMYAGEHTAGTELMIGPLFVAAGVSAFDLVFGLILGNLLAVASWTLLTAPIATRSRLTLYYQLELICGRKLVTLYNLANGVMFCFLAGAMVTVSATAVGVWVDFPMPQLDDLYPNSLGWVLAVLGVGAIISIVAACGYEMVSTVANIAAPWMVLVFVAFGLVALRQLGVDSLGEAWTVAKERILPGGDPLPGQTKFTFWHVTFFAWFCNMAMHIGMADLSVFRFARRSWYGIASGAGMFLGHYVAWIAAALMYAEQLSRTPNETAVLPGPMSYRAAGVAGLVCVVVAGWTTANPTIYRAGLAFQAIVPQASRVTVTLFTGAVATLAGLFPAVTMRLLGFVALYGLLLMPMGAVVFVDFWLLRRLGMKDNFAARKGSDFNWAAGMAWLLALAACVLMMFADNLVRWGVSQGWWSVNAASLRFLEDWAQIYFVGLPGWFIAAGLYLALSRLQQRRRASIANPTD